MTAQSHSRSWCLTAIQLLASVSLILFFPMIVTGQMVDGGDTLRVAVVINCLNETVFPGGIVPEPVIIDPAVMRPSDCSLGTGHSIGANDRDRYRPYETFERVVREQGGIPLNATHKVQLKFTYFNIGGVDITNFANYPNTTTPVAFVQYGAAVKNALKLAQMIGANGGYNKTSNAFDAPCPMCPFPTAYFPQNAPGTFGRFPIIVPPLLADVVPAIIAQFTGKRVPVTLNEAFFTSCQLSKACIVIAQYAYTDDWMKCQAQPQLATPLADSVPIECLKSHDSTLAADKRPVDRRYTYGFSALPSQSAMLSQTVSWFKLKGAQSAYLFASASVDSQKVVLPPGIAALKANKINLQEVTLFPIVAWNTTYVNQLADRVIAFNPDLLILQPSTSSNLEMALSYQLLYAFYNKSWTPKAVVIPGGATQGLAAKMNAIQPGAGAYYYATAFNDVRIRTPAYDSSINSPLDFEPFPSTSDQYSPITMYYEYLKDWGTADTNPTILGGNLIPQLVMMVPNIAAKLFYLAGSDDATLMQQASLSMSVPSQGGLLQFDQYGRIAQNDQWVAQYGKVETDYHLITPIDVGDPDVYPMPTWAERVAPDQGSASFLGTANEQGVVAVTTIVNGYLLCLLIGVVIRRHSQVMKSASPIFCVTSLLGGMICISSNYGNSLYAVKEGCGANAWLLTTGFTLMFSSLFAKTWRIHKIFRPGKLQVVKISNTDLYLIIGLSVGISVLVNIIWSGVSGFPVEYVTVDPIRPVYDYVQCHYGNAGNSFVYFHLAYTGLLIACGIALAIAARNVPAMFNETPYIAASMYNCSVLLFFLVPIVGAGVGSRSTNYLIRCYGLLVCVASTASILFLPKFYLLTQKSPTEAFAQTAKNTVTQVTHNHSALESTPTPGQQNTTHVAPGGVTSVGGVMRIRVDENGGSSGKYVDERAQATIKELREEIAQLRQRLTKSPTSARSAISDSQPLLPGAVAFQDEQLIQPLPQLPQQLEEEEEGVPSSLHHAPAVPESMMGEGVVGHVTIGIAP